MRRIRTDRIEHNAVQIRLRGDQDDRIEQLCKDRGMKKTDVLGKVMSWFLNLHSDAQACILGQLSPEGQLLVIDRVRDAMIKHLLKEGSTHLVMSSASRHSDSGTLESRKDRRDRAS